MKNVAKKKMGRPIIGQPKNVDLRVRVDELTNEKINRLCEKKQISKSELIRQLVKKAK